MKAIASVLLILSVAFITSCRAKVPKQQINTTDTVSERLIADECRGKVWVNNPPEEDARFIYFVGKSEKFAEEKGAREAAMGDVTEQFVKYTGIEVSTVHEYMKVSYGLASQVQDATVSGKSGAKSFAEAFVSRIKAREWCGQRYQRMSGGQVVGRIYLATLLARVPRSEVDNVKKWQATAAVRRLNNIQEKRDGSLRRAQNFYNSALQNEKNGLLLGAFANLISAEKSLRLAAGADPQGKILNRPKPPAPTEPDIRMLETRMSSGITLTAKNSHLTLEPNAPPGRLTVVAIYRGAGNPVPISGLPILFLSGSRLLRQARTNGMGEASMTMGVIPRRGQYNFSARIARGNLRDQVPQAAMEAFSGLQVDFQVTVGSVPLEQRARELVASLEKDIQQKQLTVVVENFTFEETGQAGPFINRFREALNTHLVKSHRFLVKEPKSRKGQTRGFSVVASDSPVALAHASGSQGVLYGNYSRLNDYVVVRANLKNTENVLVASGSVQVTPPPGMDLLPSNSGAVAAAASTMGDVGKKNDFRLDLWIDKGDGATYKEGDKLFVNLRSERECFVKLVYYTASGQKIVIFPNDFDRNTRIEPNRVYQIPNQQSTFDFVVEPPFGAEMLIAFASTKALPKDQGQDLGGGMVGLRESLGVIARKNRRGVGVQQRKVLYAEKRVRLTTIPR